MTVREWVKDKIDALGSGTIAASEATAMAQMARAATRHEELRFALAKEMGYLKPGDVPEVEEMMGDVKSSRVSIKAVK